MAPPHRYRVLRHDGSELTADLDHAAGASIEEFGLKRGMIAPQAQLGRWSLPLLPPQITQREKKATGADYAQLLKGMRIEQYDRRREEASGLGRVFDPKATGVIDQVVPTLTGLTLEGTDFLAVLDKAKTEREQDISDTATNVIDYALRDWALAYGDDFSLGENGTRVTGWSSVDEDLIVQEPVFLAGGAATPYTQITQPYGDPDTIEWRSSLWGLSRPCAAFAVAPEFGARSSVMHTGAFKFDQTPPVKFDATFRLRIPPLDPGAPEGAAISAQGGIVIAYDTTKALEAGVLLTMAQARETKLTLFLRRWSNNGAIIAIPEMVNIPLPGETIDALGWTTQTVQLSVVITPTGALVQLRGQDLEGNAAVFDTTMLNGTNVAGNTGSIGIRGEVWQDAAAGNIEQVKVLCRDLYLWTRQPLFRLAPGFPVTTDIITHTFNKTSCLEVLMIAANDADLDVRKVCKPDMDLIEAGPFLPIATDLAQGHTATAAASSGGAGFVPGKAVDGNDATYWAGTAPMSDEWLAVDLGAPTEIGAIRVKSLYEPNHGGHGILRYRIQSSPDGTTWALRASVWPSHADEVTYLDANYTARYWRIRIDGGGIGIPDIVTFGLYGPLPVFKDGPGGNVVDGGLQDASSDFATVLRLTGGGGEGDPMGYEVRDLAQIRQYGRIVREEGLQDVVPYDSLMRAGDSLAALSASPLASGSLTVRDVATAGLWRDGSMVRVQLSRVPGMTDVVKQVVGFSGTEGSDKKTVHLDQYPNSLARLVIQKQVSALDKAVSGSLRRDHLPPITALQKDNQTGRAAADTGPQVALTAPYRAVAFGGSSADWGPGAVPGLYLESWQPDPVPFGTWVRIGVSALLDPDAYTQLGGTTWLIAYPWAPRHTRLRIRWEGSVGWDGTIFMSALA